MVRLPFPLKYLSELTSGKTALWCYLIWYLVTVAAHFNSSPGLWLTSSGISVVIGIALLSVHLAPGVVPNRSHTFRLFLMPFCVASFSALIKGHGYYLVLPSRPLELGLSVSLCAFFVLLVLSPTRTQQDFRL